MNSTAFQYSSALKKLTITLLTVSFLTSCSTATKSTLLGSAIGLTVGGLFGSLANQNADQDDRTRGTLVGGTIGAGLGAIFGYESFKQKQKVMTSVPNIKDFEKDPKTPSVTTPEVRRLWVPDKIDGNKYETGHWIFILEKTTTWGQSNEK